MKKSELKEIIKELYAEVVNENTLNEANVALQADAEFRSFYAQFERRTDDENKRIFTALINKYMTTFREVKDTYVKFMNKHIPKKGWYKVSRDVEVKPDKWKSTFGKYKFIYQIKSLKSMIDKVIKRGKDIFAIGDLIRGAVVFKNPEELDMWVKTFRRRASSKITSYEFKKHGSDKTYGYYGTHHFTLHFDGFDTELIVSTEKLWKYKEEAHNIYTKWRSSNKPIPKEDLAYSKHLFHIGNLREIAEENNEEVEL